MANLENQQTPQATPAPATVDTNTAQAAIDAFNALKPAKRRAAFDALDRSGFRRRSPGVSHNFVVDFSFDDDNGICYVRHSEYDESYICACPAAEADEEIDWWLDDVEGRCDEAGMQFGDCQVNDAYGQAARRIVANSVSRRLAERLDAEAERY